MPSRNQTQIRRDINRLKETIDRHDQENPSLAAIKPLVDESTTSVNSAWQNYQSAAVKGDKERRERDDAVSLLISWIQRWRPVVMLKVPGAAMNIRNLPASGATPDDVIRVAEDLLKFISENPATESFRTQANQELGEGIAAARKETSEATAALPEEAAARQAYSEACLNANAVLVRGLDIIRAIFGRTSPEYKQFIARASAREEEEIARESALGEE